jgi:hypothetical protein
MGPKRSKTASKTACKRSRHSSSVADDDENNDEKRGAKRSRVDGLLPRHLADVIIHPLATVLPLLQLIGGYVGYLPNRDTGLADINRTPFGHYCSQFCVTADGRIVTVQDNQTDKFTLRLFDSAGKLLHTGVSWLILGSPVIVKKIIPLAPDSFWAIINHQVLQLSWMGDSIHYRTSPTNGIAATEIANYPGRNAIYMMDIPGAVHTIGYHLTIKEQQRVGQAHLAEFKYFPGRMVASDSYVVLSGFSSIGDDRPCQWKLIVLEAHTLQFIGYVDDVNACSSSEAITYPSSTMSIYGNVLFTCRDNDGVISALSMSSWDRAKKIDGNNGPLPRDLIQTIEISPYLHSHTLCIAYAHDRILASDIGWYNNHALIEIT